MSTLENLKTQGKTVGIISHVEAVKKRVKTRIEMQKDAEGRSSFKVVGWSWTTGAKGIANLFAIRGGTWMCHQN